MTDLNVLPTGSLESGEEMDARTGKHIGSEVAEAAYRRGIVHGLQLAINAAEAITPIVAPVGKKYTDKLQKLQIRAVKFRRDGKPHESLMNEIENR